MSIFFRGFKQVKIFRKISNLQFYFPICIVESIETDRKKIISSIQCVCNKIKKRQKISTKERINRCTFFVLCVYNCVFSISASFLFSSDESVFMRAQATASWIEMKSPSCPLIS